MSQIHQLPTILSNQIAAGEVVERPASVVKELVENSIDAGSTKIDIDVSQSGLKSIKVVDNGSGIAPGQVDLAFQRFATSKIATKNDLFSVHSLGFRGEALPSIASVAKVSMKTSNGEDEGTELAVRGGKIVKERPAATRRGSSVEVSDLFFNTPSRLKYLKAPKTELAKITDIVNRLALSHPEIAFTLIHDGKEVLRTSGRNNMQQVIAGIYGNKVMREMIPVSAENPDFKVSGYISKPELTRASRKYISLILNGRFIRDFALDHSIVDGYGSKLMVGRFPVVVLSVKLDSKLVDVNVHPNKEEVRISKEKELGSFISQTIYGALAKLNLIPDAKDNTAFVHGVERHNSSEISFDLDQKIATDQQETAQYVQKKDEVVKQGPEKHQPLIVRTKNDLKNPAIVDFTKRFMEESTELPFGGHPEAPNAKHDFPSLRFVGQVHGTYLISESPDGMYIVDQHAAQERINYENFRKKAGEVGKNQQKMLVTMVLDYPASDAVIIADKLDLLASVGINLEPFGRNSFSVHEHPTWIEPGNEEKTIKKMIEWVLNDKHLTTAEFLEKTAIMASCKAAIKANHHLDDRQAQALLDNLQKCENPYNCPHGRPVLIRFSNTDLETMFKRIQDPHDSSGLAF